MNELKLRKIIRMLLEEEESEKKDSLLTEPDLPANEDDEKVEASAVGAAGGTAPSGAIRGSTAPIGKGPAHPKKSKKSKDKKNQSVGIRSFGGAQ